MNLAIGIDCEGLERFRKVMDDPRLMARIFTPGETEYCMARADPSKHLAVRFAAKEALIKAFSDLGHQVPMGDIEITNHPSGRPLASVKGVQGYTIKISLSHSQDLAVAQALVYQTDDDQPPSEIRPETASRSGSVPEHGSVPR